MTQQELDTTYRPGLHMRMRCTVLRAVSFSSTTRCCCVCLQVIPGLPRPLVKICDFGYSKHDNRSVARSKVVSSSTSRSFVCTAAVLEAAGTATLCPFQP